MGGAGEEVTQHTRTHTLSLSLFSLAARACAPIFIKYTRVCTCARFYLLSSLFFLIERAKTPFYPFAGGGGFAGGFRDSDSDDEGMNAPNKTLAFADERGEPLATYMW